MTDNRTTPLDGITLLAPWEHTTARLHEVLEREVAPGHPLFGISTRALARHCDNDDVLFALTDAPSSFAVVHLTWKGAPDSAPNYPSAEYYRSLEEWITLRMTPDHAEYEAEDGD